MPNWTCEPESSQITASDVSGEQERGGRRGREEGRKEEGGGGRRGWDEGEEGEDRGREEGGEAEGGRKKGMGDYEKKKGRAKAKERIEEERRGGIRVGVRGSGVEKRREGGEGRT